MKKEQWVVSVLDKAHWSTVKVRDAISLVYHRPKEYIPETFQVIPRSY